jgi:hypothetical protein
MLTMSIATIRAVYAPLENPKRKISSPGLKLLEEEVLALGWGCRENGYSLSDKGVRFFNFVRYEVGQNVSTPEKRIVMKSYTPNEPPVVPVPGR